MIGKIITLLKLKIISLVTMKLKYPSLAAMSYDFADQGS